MGDKKGNMSLIFVDPADKLFRRCKKLDHNYPDLQKVYTILFLITIALLLLNNARGQNPNTTTRFGNTLNIGVGMGYYGYINQSVPVVHLDYEFDVAKDFTLAPFVSFYSFRREHYYGNPSKGYNYYRYTETAIPIGAKGTYYFDELVQAGSKWDFYVAGSLGFVIINSGWDDGYDGDRNIYRRSNPLYLNAHIGTEYHLNSRAGIFLDLSTGVSTIGLSIH